MEKAFWLVWNDGGYAPTHKHETERSAVTEAERLARANPGCRFVVMQSLVAREVNSMQRIQYDCDFSTPF